MIRIQCTACIARFESDAVTSGARLKCPSCGQQFRIALPKPKPPRAKSDAAPAQGSSLDRAGQPNDGNAALPRIDLDTGAPRGRFRRWLRRQRGFAVSASVHAAVVVLLALWTVGLLEPEQLEVLLLTNAPREATELNQVKLVEVEEVPADNLEFEPLANPESDVILDAPEAHEVGTITSDAAAQVGAERLFDGNLLSALGKGVAGQVSGGSPGGSGSPEGGLKDESFTEMIDYARENGLDIVLAFDSTGSMGTEINVVKERILLVGGALLSKVPSTQISVVTYRDKKDKYLVHGLPLTNNLQAIYQYLAKIEAAGGGDGPEAVEYGLKWSMTNNFRPHARRVILLFGDAPPHAEDRQFCV